MDHTAPLATHSATTASDAIAVTDCHAEHETTWHIFCKVVDNYGDIGVCWRLACQLANRGKSVRLWVDDSSALTWMAPAGHLNVTVMDCAHGLPKSVALKATDIFIDTFGCEFAIDLIALQAINTPPKAEFFDINKPNQLVWVNLEHLTAESFAQRNHTLTYIRQGGKFAGWRQSYFYPGFIDKTGGLLREMDLLLRQQVFDRREWLEHVLSVNQLKFDSHTHYISLFCYEPEALHQLIEQLTATTTPICLLVTAGRAKSAVKAVLEHQIRLNRAYSLPKLLSIVYLNPLTQTDYDHLLWSCDLNFVRGEDSLVRAIWAGKPFIWQIYQQDDGVHHAKLDAFLQLLQAPESLQIAFRVWNADSWRPISQSLPKELFNADWASCVTSLRSKLLQQADLVTNLVEFCTKNE